MNYMIKLTGCRVEGRSVDGEYEGGATIADARKEAEFFVEHCPTGRISIVRPIMQGDALSHVETVRA